MDVKGRCVGSIFDECSLEIPSKGTDRFQKKMTLFQMTRLRLQLSIAWKFLITFSPKGD